MTAALASGMDPRDLPPPPPTVDHSLKECPHCHRRFNETAHARHVPQCQNIMVGTLSTPSRSAQTPHTSDGLDPL